MKIPVQQSHAADVHRAAKSASKDSEKLSDPSTQQRDTDDSGDARDGSGEDNHHGRSKEKVPQQRDTPSKKRRGGTS